MAMTELCWWPLTAWISPGAALFVFFNVLVGAIAVTSRASSRHRRLCRSASSMVLDRLRSFTIFSVHPAAEYCYHTSLEADQQQVMSWSMSPEPAAAEPHSAPAQAPGATNAEASTMSNTHNDVAGEANVQDKDQQYDAPHQLPRPAPATAAAENDEATAAVERQGRKKPSNKVAGKRSKRRARATCREGEAEEEEAELNERAELFIRQFREDLRLQRLNSIINYTRALRRGDSDSAAPEQN